MTNWKVGKWCILDMKIGQITRLDEHGGARFSDGSVEICGQLVERFRPLTLTNKVIADCAQYYYNQLTNIDGEAGFNYPDIYNYFANCVMQGIDDPARSDKAFSKILDFVKAARAYTPVIDGVRLFRRK